MKKREIIKYNDLDKEFSKKKVKMIKQGIEEGLITPKIKHPDSGELIGVSIKTYKKILNGEYVTFDDILRESKLN